MARLSARLRALAPLPVAARRDAWYLRDRTLGGGHAKGRIRQRGVGPRSAAAPQTHENQSDCHQRHGSRLRHRTDDHVDSSQRRRRQELSWGTEEDAVRIEGDAGGRQVEVRLRREGDTRDPAEVTAGEVESVAIERAGRGQGELGGRDVDREAGDIDIRRDENIARRDDGSRWELDRRADRRGGPARWWRRRAQVPCSRTR